MGKNELHYREGEHNNSIESAEDVDYHKFLEGRRILLAEEMAMASGMDGHIAKPIEVPVLFEKIKEILR